MKDRSLFTAVRNLALAVTIVGIGLLEASKKPLYPSRGDRIAEVLRTQASLPQNLNKILLAVSLVESGGSPNDGQYARGDYDRHTKTYLARGSFQIHWAYFEDAKLLSRKVREGTYNDCDKFDFSVHVVISYWKRYAKDIMAKDVLSLEDMEILARKHNGGGPSGHRRKTTIPYWNKVKQVLSKL